MEIKTMYDYDERPICECSQCANNQTKDCMIATIFPWITISDVNGFKRIVDCPYYIERSVTK